MTAALCVQTLAKIKRVLLRTAGIDGIRALSRALKISDDCSVATVAHSTLLSTLTELGVALGDKEQQSLWAVFDRQGDGTVVITEFLAGLRQGLSPLRRSLLSRTWQVFDKDNDGHVSLNQLLSRFDAERHPSVLRGEATAQSIHEAFEHSFDNSTNPEGAVSKQEYEQYYAMVSASMDSDAMFASMIRGCWHLPGANEEETTALAFADDTHKFAVSQRQNSRESILSDLKLQDTFNSTIAKHQELLRHSQVGFRNLGSGFRSADPKRLGYISKDVFLDVLWKGRLYFDEPRTLQLLDTNADGTIDYKLYMATVKGELPPCRQLLMERQWRSFPRDRRDSTTLAAIHGAYHPPNGEALSKFLDAWDRNKASSQVVTYNEFEEWLIPASVAIPLDNGFEEVLDKQWF